MPDGGDVFPLKKRVEQMPRERLRWRVLRSFGTLPSSDAAKAMTDRDYLLCALHLILDQEEQLEKLCPSCRNRAKEAHCPVCGEETLAWQREENASFDWERFAALSKEGAP